MEDFKITERFMPIWVSAFMGIALLYILCYMYSTNVLGSINSTVTFCIILFIYLILLILTLMKLSIIISEKNIRYHFSVFGLEGKYTEIAKEEINTITLRGFSAISEFGGFGYRFGKKGYTGYIVKGNHGIDIQYLKENFDAFTASGVIDDQYLSRKILLSISDFDTINKILKKYNYL